MSTPANALPPVTPPAAEPAAPPPAPPPSSSAPPANTPPPSGEPGTPPANEPPGEPGRSRSQDRIEELIAQNKAEREAMAEFAEYWRQQALGRGAPPPNNEPPAEQPDPPPTLEQNGYDAVKWQAAHAEWTQREIARQVKTGVTTTLQTTRAAETEAQAAQRWNTGLADYEKANPGATATIYNPKLQISPAMRDVIATAEDGIAMAHYLGKNPLEALRISRLPATLAAMEMGSLRASMRAAATAGQPPPTPPAPKHSNAPAPPSAPGSTGGAPGVDLTTCSLDDYLRIRLEQRQARAARR